MKKVSLLVTALTCAMLVVPSFAATEKAATHCEFAQILANAIGLTPKLPPAATCDTVVRALTAVGIAPLGGWKPGQTVTKEDLAVAIVQAANLQFEVKDLKDPKAYIAVIEKHGIKLDQAGTTVKTSEKIINEQGIVVDDKKAVSSLETAALLTKQDSKTLQATAEKQAKNTGIDVSFQAVLDAKAGQAISQAVNNPNNQNPPPKVGDDVFFSALQLMAVLRDMGVPVPDNPPVTPTL